MESTLNTEETPGKPTQALVPLNGKVTALLNKEVITHDDITGFTKDEKQQLNESLTRTAGELKGVERDRFLKKIEPIMSTDSRNDLWETNHAAIASTISEYLHENGRMPSKAEIARETGLSRLTIHKHIKEYSQHPLFADKQEEFKMAKDRLMSMLYQSAMSNGNVQAVRLFFEASGILDNGKTVNKNIIENQHNYIQINETRLSQEEIKKLSPERLKQIEMLLKMPEKAAE